MDYITLSSGDIVVDSLTKETGLLVMRFDVMAAHNERTRYPVWAWDILWAGSKLLGESHRRSAYTEEGLLNMIRDGTFLHFKNI